MTMESGSRYETTTSSGVSPEGGSTDRLKDTAGDAVDRATETAQKAVGTKVESQLERAADMLDHVADAVRKTGDQLQAEQPQVGGAAHAAADQVERASSFLRQSDMQSIVGEVEDFARRQPVLFVGGALALGALAARFLKASPARRPDRWSDGDRYRDRYARFDGPRSVGGSGFEDGYRPGGGSGSTNYETTAGSTYDRVREPTGYDRDGGV